MAITNTPEAEVAIDERLIRGLLRAQHPDLADEPLSIVAHGWDNVLARLGDALVVRLPRRAVAAALVLHEQRWLPELAPRLPLPIPVPLRAGVPGDGFPWPWSVCPWFDGDNAAAATLADVDAAAVALAAFVTALHRPAPADAPMNPFRGVPLAARASLVHGYLDQPVRASTNARCGGGGTRPRRSRRTTGPPLWLHGDLHPANLVVHDGSLAPSSTSATSRAAIPRPTSPSRGCSSRRRPARASEPPSAASTTAWRRPPEMRSPTRSRVSRGRETPLLSRPSDDERSPRPRRRRLRAQSERMPCSTVCRVAKRAARIPASSVITRTSATVDRTPRRVEVEEVADQVTVADRDPEVRGDRSDQTSERHPMAPIASDSCDRAAHVVASADQTPECELATAGDDRGEDEIEDTGDGDDRNQQLDRVGEGEGIDEDVADVASASWPSAPGARTGRERRRRSPRAPPPIRPARATKKRFTVRSGQNSW
jgi:hypothetical protein